MIYSRTQAAWYLSCEKLFQEWAPIYFWTFTFAKVLPDWWYPYRWHGFIRDLQKLYGGHLMGLRVIELHSEHGLHYHALLNKRIWVGFVRRIGKRYGIGRVQVHKQAATPGAAFYLGQYLDKRKFPSQSRLARWHSVGGFPSVKVKNIEIQSPLNSKIQEALEANNGRITLPQYQHIYLEHYDLLCRPKNPEWSLKPESSSGPSSCSNTDLFPLDSAHGLPESHDSASMKSGGSDLHRCMSGDSASSSRTSSSTGSSGTPTPNPLPRSQVHRVYQLR